MPREPLEGGRRGWKNESRFADDPKIYPRSSLKICFVTLMDIFDIITVRNKTDPITGKREKIAPMKIKKLCLPLTVLLLLFASCAAARGISPHDSSGFVDLSEAVPDAVLEIRYHSDYNFVGERIDGYEEPRALLTEKAAKALKAVSDELITKGYRLKIYDAYRPQRAVTHFVRWAKDLDDTRMKEHFYPGLDKSVLFKKGYISKKSGHSRGSTVDLTLFDVNAGEDVDMGGVFDYFGQRSHWDYKGLTREQRENRAILRRAMAAHGFKPISTEWWHFTLKDEPYPKTYFDFPVRKLKEGESGLQKGRNHG